MPLIEELVALLGPTSVRHHPLDRAVFSKDAGILKGEVIAAVLPETAQEVAAIVRIARRHDVPIVPRGAGTGLAGGAVPVDPGLLIVLTRLNRVHEVDEIGRTAWVGPGVINLDLSRQVEPLGLHFAPDPSSQQACTIGGNVATNAGGPHCLADGTTVAHVLAVEFVTAEGDIVTVGSEAPDQPGLDLRAVLVGSEGTLGIITKVLVRLTENAPDVATMLIGFPTIEGAAATVSGIIASGLIPAALEIMDQPMVEAVENFVHAGYPTDAGAVLLAEVTGTSESVAAGVEIIRSVAERHAPTDVRVATDDAERAILWKGRKSAFGAVAQVAPDYYLHDTVVPRTALVEVMSKIYEIGDRYDLTMLNVFHAGDGNLHPLVAFDSKEPGMLEKVQAAAREMVEVSIDAGGSLSGEHGIGHEKRDLMHLVFSDVDLDAQARVREAFDEAGMMNPSKVLPEGSRCFDASGVRL
ncbi:MAG: FAD-linked oxidase C-terminal domain-containing protein [Actinomycetota bacterium]|nr:FAD-linked oxidase C-terminal domain-containing protein [Actinomycetota bacterium]MDK1102330.1 FAD-linked oxidase C-terminal domain-containing protein [Actinomycetota bacterium]MDK1292624.1 FAD-linked oxidase C-terminal domain-containing protein [Actinomycetota bacterium]